MGEGEGVHKYWTAYHISRKVAVFSLTFNRSLWFNFESSLRIDLQQISTCLQVPNMEKKYLMFRQFVNDAIKKTATLSTVLTIKYCLFYQISVASLINIKIINASDKYSSIDHLDCIRKPPNDKWSQKT